MLFFLVIEVAICTLEFFNVPVFCLCIFASFSVDYLFGKKKATRQSPTLKIWNFKRTQGFSPNVHNRLSFHVETCSYSITFMGLEPILFLVTERPGDNKHQCLASKLWVYLRNSARISRAKLKPKGSGARSEMNRVAYQTYPYGAQGETQVI